ncbi:MAG: RCC1 domain-containing protein [Anaeroplasmataceae bacterium]
MNRTIKITSGENVIEYEIGKLYVHNGAYYIIDINKKLWVNGVNTVGQLGIGSIENQTEWSSPETLSGVKVDKLIFQNNTVYLFTEISQLWVAGFNDVGQCGVGNLANVTSFTKPEAISGVIVKEFFWRDHPNFNNMYVNKVYFLDLNDNLWVCGINTYGELGTGNINNVSTWTKITSVGKVKNLFVYAATTFVIDMDNKLWSSGQNQLGNCGRNSQTEKITTFGKMRGSIENVNIKSVYGFDHSSYAIDENDMLWTCGEGHNGQHGHDHENKVVSFAKPNNLSNIKIKFIYKNNDDVFAITTDDRLLVCGINMYGQLGLGVDPANGAMVKTFRWTGHDIEKVKIKFFVYKKNNSYYNQVVDTSNRLWVCGLNDVGQLGVGDTNYKTKWQIPPVLKNVEVFKISAGPHYSHILDKDGKMWSTGNSSNGRLGLGTTGNVLTYTSPPQFLNIKIKDFNDDNGKRTYAIDVNDHLWVTGENASGQLGTGDNVDVLTWTRPKSLKDRRVFMYHSDTSNMILLDLDTGEFLSCGINTSDQLSLDVSENINTWTVLKNVKENKIKMAFTKIDHFIAKIINGGVFAAQSNKRLLKEIPSLKEEDLNGLLYIADKNSDDESENFIVLSGKDDIYHNDNNGNYILGDTYEGRKESKPEENKN